MNYNLVAGPILLESGVQSAPHIDMWSDDQIISSGIMPSLHEYIITWAGANQEMHVTYDDIQNTVTTGNISTVHQVSSCSVSSNGNDCEAIHPDVAAYSDISAGFRDMRFVISHIKPVIPGMPYAGERDLYVTECDLPGGLSSPPNVVNDQILEAYIPSSFSIGRYPRVESMSLNDGSYAAWQVIANANYWSGDDVRTYSQVNLFPPILSNLNQTITPVVALGVAAGVGLPNIYGRNVGNEVYVTGYTNFYLPYPSTTNTGYIYSDEIDKFTGLKVNSHDGYIVNNNQITYGWDLPQHLGMSSSSNMGTFILVAWYDGDFIKYKVSDHSYNPIHYKTTTVADLKGVKAPTLYPNPAKDNIYLNHISRANYKITSITGSLLREGYYQEGTTIDISNLPTGVYILQLEQKGAAIKNFTFTKN